MTPPDTMIATLKGLCPRCGQGKLFKGYLDVAPACSACGLDYAIFDAGDGPAVFVILIVGAIVAGAALYVEFTWSPPYWVHALLWGPLIVVLTFSLLRLMKSLLLVLQFKRDAREGRPVE
jgi:uncharacterized protein (DUF983 family)